MSYYRGPPQQRGRYDYNNGAYANADPYQQQGGQQQWRDDRNYYRGGRPQPQQQQTYSAPQQYNRAQQVAHSRPSPPPTKSPRTEAKEILDDVRSTKDQKTRAFKLLLDGARAAPHSARAVSALTSAFPQFAQEQQEEVVDFVYDLCEDPNPAVRMQGYRTIVELSKSVPSWTRRNADVLVQLLQSDSQDELRVIREALLSHIRTDPAAAMEIITEHMARAGEAEEKTGDASQGAMKRLVLEFLKSPEAQQVQKESFVAGRPAEVSFNSGASEAIRYSSPRDAKDLLSLVQALPSWTGQLQPNPFRTPSITSLLDRSVILAQKDAINESQALYTLAQGAAEAGNGDPRAFIRFWAKMGWADWSSAEAYEYGQAATLLRWLKASMTVWENLRRASRDDDPLFEERTLGGEVSALALDLLYTAASTFERDGAAKQEKMWAFLDTMLAVFTRLAETRMEIQPLRDAFSSDPIKKMVRFAYETRNARGSGLSPETMRLLRSISSKCDTLYRDLDLPSPVPDHLRSSLRTSDLSPSSIGTKRSADGLQIAGSARGPVKIARNQATNRDPPRAPLSMIRSHLQASEASPVPSRQDSPPRRGTDLITGASATDFSDDRDRPGKRPRLSVEGDGSPARSLSLLERINGTNPKPTGRTTPTNGSRSNSDPPTGPRQRSLAERLNVKGAAAATGAGARAWQGKGEDPISIRGAAGPGASLASRLSKPAPASLLERISK